MWLGSSFTVKPWSTPMGAGYLIESRELGELAWSNSYENANQIAAMLADHSRCLEPCPVPAPSPRISLARTDQPVEVDELVGLLERARKAIHVAICPPKGCLETCELMRARADQLRRGR